MNTNHEKVDTGGDWQIDRGNLGCGVLIIVSGLTIWPLAVYGAWQLGARLWEVISR